MNRPFALLLGLLLSGPLTILMASEAYIVRATELRAEPFSDAKMVMALTAETSLKTLKRKGGWYQVEVAGKVGWVRMSSLRLGSADKAEGSSGVGSALRFLGSGRAGASEVTPATGIRGLDAADINSAEPDHEALKRFKQHSDAEQSKQFAKEGGLKPKSLPYPKRVAGEEKPQANSGSRWDNEGGF